MVKRQTTIERDTNVRKILDNFYKQAVSKKVVGDSKYKSDLDNLFKTTDWGHRELLLVIIVAMKMDPSFKPTSELYKLHPRAIFEGVMKEFLIEKRIPHRKSGPLNIAKATPRLDESWAAQRGDKEAANSLVELIGLLESRKKIIDTMGISLMRKFLAEVVRIESLHINLPPSSDPNLLYIFCKELITKTPDSGNTPQKIAALLLKNYHSSMNTGIIVTGGDDRASVTSTTSKKPGDINEESTDGQIYKVYEITVKPFDISRIRDSYDCIKIYRDSNQCKLNEIIVVCRVEDCPDDLIRSGMHLYLGSYKYQDIIYYYWDIYEWISSMLQRMTPSARITFYTDLNGYISDMNTAESVKKLWQNLQS